MSHSRKDHKKSDHKHHHHHAHSPTLFHEKPKEANQEVNVNVTIEQPDGDDCFTTCMGGLGACIGKAAGNAI